MHAETAAPQGVETDREVPEVADGIKFVRLLLVFVLIVAIVWWWAASRHTSSSTRIAVAASAAPAPKPAERPPAPPEGPAEAKSGVAPDMPRAISSVLSAPMNWFSETKKEPPRPPEGVIEVWLRPGEPFWEGAISKGHPTPWLTVKEEVFLFIDTGGGGSQHWEFYPGNSNIRRAVEDSSTRPLPTRVYGEVPAK